MTYKINILVYKYNGIWNNKVGDTRNCYNIVPIEGNDKDIQSKILDLLDTIPENRGYLMSKQNNKSYIYSKDMHNPNTYIRNEITYHPLMDKLN